MSIASVALLLFAVVSAATGQLMLKHGMQIATARVADSGGDLGGLAPGRVRAAHRGADQAIAGRSLAAERCPAGQEAGTPAAWPRDIAACNGRAGRTWLSRFFR